MEISLTNQRLARRLLGQYLLFGLTSIVVLAVGVAALGTSLGRSSGERELYNRINEVRSLISADQDRNQGKTTQALVGLLSTEDWVSYAGIINSDGKYTAHSKPTRIGQTSVTRPLASGTQSVIERQTVWEEGRSVREYWAPLQTRGSEISYLQVGVAETESPHWFHRLGDWLPLGITAPIAVLLVGAYFVRGAARTHAAIEDQLFAVSSGQPNSDLALKPLTEPSPLAAGWNRLVDTVTGRAAVPNLESKLSRSLGALQEKRTEFILANLPDGVALADQQGAIIYCNRAFGVVLRHPEDESKLRGRAVRELLPPASARHWDTLELSRPAIHETQLGATPAEGVLRVGRYPIVREDNATPQYLWTVRDVTQQKLADEMRTQFVYAATHELRTPLANIKAYAETLTLNDMPDPEQQKGFLNIINSEATRLARFVEELLNVSQMEAGALTLARTGVDLERLLNEAAEKVRPQMQQKEITFDVMFPPKLPKIQVDKDRLTAALVNLLGNAAKYTPEHGRVTFETAAGPKELQISVKDTGFGISREELPKLFSKFFRSEDTRVRDVPGSGLGLSFAQEVARLHGGKLLVQSELNKGSQFTLILPLAS